MDRFQSKVNFIWSVADLLRGDYKAFEYADVILPFVVLRRLDCVLEKTKPAVLSQFDALSGQIENLQPALTRTSGYNFYNTSRFDFAKLLDDANNIAANLRAYINGFSNNVQDILDKFAFREELERLNSANLLYLIVQKFGEIDLHPDAVSNHEMGYIFEELIRRFSEQSNETAGEHFTPREVIRLMVNLLFSPDSAELKHKGVVRTVYDPACGTGGMLTVAKEHVLATINREARIELFGQELNPKSYAVCKADMLIKGERDDNIKQGNSFNEDHLRGHHFDYMLSNPPFGVEWKKVESDIRDEVECTPFCGPGAK